MKRNWFARHPIGFMALYFLLYLSAFNFLETQISMPRVLLVHCRLDDLIPFCKYAILPYFAWFAWIPFTLFYLLWKAPREDFWRLCLPLFGGMTNHSVLENEKFDMISTCAPTMCRAPIFLPVPFGCCTAPTPPPTCARPSMCSTR